MFKILKIIFGTPLSLLYLLAIKIKYHLYSANILQVAEFNTPIISVGNLTVGGTGKTPMVIFLAEMLKSNFQRIVILSRGYKRKSSGFLIVRDFNSLISDAESSGDEPYLIANVLNHCAVCVDANRQRGINEIESKLNPDLIILDDGFQQKGIKKDCEIVLLNASKPYQELSLLPVGLAREPTTILHSANIIIYTKSTNHLHPEWSDKIPDIQSFTSIYQVSIWEFSNSLYTQVGEITSPVFAFCGIGDPDSFYSILKAQNISIAGFHPLRDHENYNDTTISKLEDKINQQNTSAVITTEKDLVKLPDSFLQKFHIFALRVVHALNNEDEYLKAVLSNINGNK